MRGVIRNEFCALCYNARMVQPLGVRKRTKIVATIGPASAAKSVLGQMLKSGMDVARINFSHGTADRNLALLEAVRSVARTFDQPLAVLQDLQGPRLRVGTLPPAGQVLLDGTVVTLRVGVTTAEAGVIPIPQGRVSKELKRGDLLLLDEGNLELKVMKIEGRRIYARVLLGGVLRSYKSITVPTAALSIESLTDKDVSDVVLGLRSGVDFVALSFVRSAHDIVQLRAVIEKYLPRDSFPPGVIAKIEKHEALQNFDAILEEADGIMIARGDLGLETPLSQVPVRQKELIAKCVVAGKPVIVSTQMLSSMQHKLRPTRAEVSDVANAVLDHTDAVMLSEETAMGRYPVQSVKMMAETIVATEESPLDTLLPDRETSGEDVSLAVGAAAVELARRVDAVALLVTTHSGYSARSVARFRLERPLFAATDDPLVQRQLGLSWGVVAFCVEGYAQPERMVELALKRLRTRYQVPAGPIVVVSGLKRKKDRYDSAVRVVDF